MTDVESILASRGPSLTNDVAAQLRKLGLSGDAARQRLSRLPADVRVLRGLSFPKRARFIYLTSQFGTDRYWKALVDAIERANPAYATALSGLQCRGGIVPLSHFHVVSGSPIKQSRQIPGTAILERLKSIKLLDTTIVDGLGECVTLGEGGHFTQAQVANLRATLLTENFFLDAFRGWIGRMNMASPNATKIRSNESAPQYSTVQFDICGPSYLRPLTRLQDSKLTPGFLVGDIFLGKVLGERDIGPFIRKCQLLGNLRKIRPFLPVIIADGFQPTALKTCRSKGIIATTPRTLFGKDVAQALNDLLQTLANSAVVAAVRPERIESLFQQLTAIEGAAGNLRGALFELIVGHMVKAIENGSLDIGLIVREAETSKQAEIDIRLIKEREVKIYECKGHQPTNVTKKAEVDKWLTKNVPTIHSAHKQEQRFSDTEFSYEFWTCGSFDEEALELLERAKSQTKKYKIGWKDGSAVRDYALKLKAPGIRKILDDHYFNHPITNALESGDSL